MLSSDSISFGLLSRHRLSQVEIRANQNCKYTLGNAAYIKYNFSPGLVSTRKPGSSSATDVINPEFGTILRQAQYPENVANVGSDRQIPEPLHAEEVDAAGVIPTVISTVRAATQGPHAGSRHHVTTANELQPVVKNGFLDGCFHSFQVASPDGAIVDEGSMSMDR